MRTQIANFECIVENPGSSNLVVLFHGYGADFSDLVPLAEILDPEGHWTWVFPNGPLQVDIGGGFRGRAWFPIDMEALMQAQMTGIPRDYTNSEPPTMPQLLADLAFFAEELKDYKKVVLGGFSQGGMVTSHLFPKMGESLKGLLLMSTVLLNEKLMREKLQSFPAQSVLQTHGTKDTVLAHQYGQKLYRLFKEYGWKTSWLDFPGGHEIPPPVLAKAQEFLHKLQN